jgi:hypothetical protein
MGNKSIRRLAWIVLAAGLPVLAARADDLERGFLNPPAEAKLRAYWWWLNGNVTKAAITRDLEEMKDKGFGGVLIFDAGGADLDGGTPVPAGPTFGSPQWRAFFRHALREADRVGLEVSLNIQSGWNLGGPLVPPERAAKTLVFSETKWTGPGAGEATLPQPKTKLGFYRDVAVVAYPAPKTTHAPIDRLKDKLAEREVGASAPDCNMLLHDVPAREGEQACMASDVIDLSAKMDKRGVLRWKAPPGQWIVLRIGCAPTGRRNSAGSGEWQGLVLDYLDAENLRWYWREVVDPLVRDAGPLAGKTWKYVHTDSWECRGMNWTPAMRDEFRRRRGYDLFPYLPVLAGRIVDSRETANRFLADFRKTVGDCIAENHYRVLARLAAAHRMGIHPEAGGPHAGPIDSLRCLGVGEIPMSEFWAKSWRGRVTDADRFFVKQPASVAHTYGRRLVAAEGFTAIGPQWQATLWDDLKPSFDRAACDGMNRLFWHTVTCAPVETGMPGQEYYAGTHFNPNCTWWPYSGPFLAYLNRCQYMLQQGLFVADAVYYYGDHVPNFTQLKSSDPAKVQPGYDYDVATEEVVLSRMNVQDGRIVLPDGMSYRVLVLPPLRAISLPVLRRVKELTEAGATVIGPKPERASGLGGQPQDDEEVRRLADTLWGDDGKGRHVGKGRVIVGRTARQVLQDDGVAPDFEYSRGLSQFSRSENGTVPLALDYIHRRDGDADIYFVRNCRSQVQTADVTFRVAGRQPALWDAVTGTIRPLPEYRAEQGRTVVPLRFEPYGSWFVVFRNQPEKAMVDKPRKNFADSQPVQRISGPWSVSFDPKWGGPENVVFDSLVDWTSRPEEGIRHYSGAATYRTAFELMPYAGDLKPLYLNLGTVKELARVRLNGRELGVVWCPPWRIEITDAIRPGTNHLEIEVVNFWPNRLIGDAKLSPERRRTSTNIRRLTGDTPLMPSGLLGPVEITSTD